MLVVKRSHGLFGGAGGEQRGLLYQDIRCAPGEIIYAEGDRADAAFLLKSGHVRLYQVNEDGKEITLAIIGEGEFFGELALFDNGPRTTFAEAIDEARYFRVSARDALRNMMQNPHLALTIARQIALRSADVEARFADLAYGSVRERLVAALRQLATRHGQNLGNGWVRINLRLPHHEVARIVGASREHCTLAMGCLQRAGIVQVEPGHRIMFRRADL